MPDSMSVTSRIGPSTSYAFPCLPAGAIASGAIATRRPSADSKRSIGVPLSAAGEIDPAKEHRLIELRAANVSLTKSTKGPRSTSSVAETRKFWLAASDRFQPADARTAVR